jgi:hypothetical protein
MGSALGMKLRHCHDRGACAVPAGANLSAIKASMMMHCIALLIAGPNKRPYPHPGRQRTQVVDHCNSTSESLSKTSRRCGYLAAQLLRSIPFAAMRLCGDATSSV